MDRVMLLDEAGDDASAPSRRVKQLVTHQKTAEHDLWTETMVDGELLLVPKGGAECDDPDKVFDNDTPLDNDATGAGAQQEGKDDVEAGDDNLAGAATSRASEDNRPKRTRPPPGWFTDL